jgi:hypothetical protein
MLNEKVASFLISQLGPPLSPEERERLEREHAQVRIQLEALEREKREWADRQRLDRLSRKFEELYRDLKHGANRPPALTYSALTITDPDELVPRRIREYFDRIKLTFGTRLPRYNQLIEQYALAQRTAFQQHRVALLFPPVDPVDLQHPDCIKEMPPLWKATPRMGGRPPAVNVAKREQLILRNRKKSHQEICQILKQKRIPVPLLWRKANRGISPHDWPFYYAHHQDRRYTQRIHRIFSEVIRRHKIRSGQRR